MSLKTFSIIHSLILISMSCWAYFTSLSPSMTALIPAFIGIFILILNKWVEKKSVFYIVFVLNVLVSIGLIKPMMGTISKGAILSISRVALMLAVSVISIIFFALNIKKIKK